VTNEIKAAAAIYPDRITVPPVAATSSAAMAGVCAPMMLLIEYPTEIPL
jgi:hypothetical protein